MPQGGTLDITSGTLTVGGYSGSGSSIDGDLYVFAGATLNSVDTTGIYVDTGRLHLRGGTITGQFDSGFNLIQTESASTLIEGFGTLTAPVNLYGLVQLQSSAGNLIVNDALGGGGTIQALASSTLTINGGNGSFGGVGTFAVNGTAIVAAPFSAITTLVNGGGTLHETTAMNVGNAQSGTLLASGGGTISTVGATIGVASGIGNASLSGTGSAWTNTGSLNIGNDGSGSVSANGTGTLALSSNASLVNSGPLEVYSGGTLTVASGASLTTGSLDISSAGSFSFSGGSISVSNQFTGPAGTTTIGDGTSLAKFRFSGTANCGSISISNNATFGGNGTIHNGTSAIVVNSGGTITGGANDSTIGLLVSGAEKWTSGGTFLSKLAAGLGGPSSTQNDELFMSDLSVTATPISPFNISLYGLPAVTLSDGQMILLAAVQDDPSGAINAILPDLRLSETGVNVPPGDTLVLREQYVGGSTGDVLVATVTSAAPEPTSILLLGGSVALPMLARRRKVFADQSAPDHIRLSARC